MLSNLLIVTNSDVTTKDNEGRGYCLILAFFQGLYFNEGRLQVNDKQKFISDAMKLLVDNEELAREVLTEKSKNIIGTWYDKYNNICLGRPLKFESFWNYELLEFFIEISKLKVQIYYYREFVTNQYVLLNTRKSMDRKEDFKIIFILELLTGHKILITEFNDKLSVEDLLDNTNFECLIDSRDACTAYDEATFISLDICKKVMVAYDNGISGYASIAKSIGKNVDYIIQQLAEHYLNNFDDSTNSELFSKGKNLSKWVRSDQSLPFPKEFSLTLDDGILNDV